MKKKAIGIGILVLVLIGIILFVCMELHGSHKLPVITYHHIQEKGTFDIEKQGHLITTPEKLEEQLKAVQAAGYHTITIGELQAYHEKKGTLPENPILITFDDGYNSTYQYAYPILKKLNMKATVFVPCVLIRDEENPSLGHPSFFTWQQAKKMYDSGVIDIQSHTYHLHEAVKIDGIEQNAMTHKLKINDKYETIDQYKQRIHDDLKESKECIEKYVGNKIIALSFPFGDYNQTCCDISTELQMPYLFCTKEGINQLNKNSLPFKRTTVYNRITMEATYSGKEVIQVIQSY